MKSTSKDLLKIGACVLVCLLLELFFSSFSNILLFFAGAEEKELDLSEAAIYSETLDTAAEPGTTELPLSENTIEFKDVDVELENVSLDLEGDVKDIPITITFSDESWSGDIAEYKNNFSRNLKIAGDVTVYFDMMSTGKVKDLQVTFPYVSNLKLKGIRVNSYEPFGFNVSRFAILFFIALAFTFIKKQDILYDSKKHGKLVYAVIFLFVAALILSSCTDGIPLKDYPVEDISAEDQYVQLFDAFQNGRLNLEIFDDIDKLSELDDPFVVDKRDALFEGGTVCTPIFDHAYYDGKIYCYFGAAPIFTVYYPVYLLTGKIPTSVGAACIMGIPLFIFLGLLYKLFVEKFCKTKPPLLMMIMGLIALYGSSLTYAFCFKAGDYRPKAFYFIAVVSGLEWLAIFLYTLLKAYFAKSTRKRIVYLIFCGISVPMIVASRPTLFLYCATALIPAIFVFADKEEKIKNKIKYAFAVGTPVVIGAALIMVYNYARFDSPFDFGFNYQLTNLNSVGNTISLLYLPNAIYHYYFHAPELKLAYPYFKLTINYFPSYPRHTYVGNTLGILWYPITWGMFAIRSVISKKDKFKSWFLTTLLGIAIILSFIDMCKGGITLRYTADILLPLSLVAIIALFNLLGRMKKDKSLYYGAYNVIMILMLITIYISYNITQIE